MLSPGKAAVVIMASKITEDKFATAMQPYGGQLLQTSLSEQDEADLAAELGEVQPNPRQHPPDERRCRVAAISLPGVDRPEPNGKVREARCGCRASRAPLARCRPG